MNIYPVLFGKGTQCPKIAPNCGYTHLSAGDILRAERESGSENGTMIQSMMNEGKLVPSEIIVKLIQRAMQESGNDKFLIDGFPRNEENRAEFESVIGIEPEFVIFFDCSEEEMIKRMLSRKQSREDDNVDTMKKRLEVYRQSSLPVIEYYNSRGMVRKIDGEKSIEVVSEAVHAVFTSLIDDVETAY
ncbi:UMP-CMP kinase 3-like isoform X1 [Olea europaea subsp. europaea]|uniref:adenylate kinase n=1 Tax=Olea europaea subsp. europaea TaxID=158383 RepID=A0A8S0QYA3_OLEEU|nr:UMP-CMP kinase 3-like isoform X1 [Olea europaea subsp. europaea]